MSDSLKRPLPLLTDLNGPFWTAGVDGVLRLQRCTMCERLIHPPALRCPHDHGVPQYTALSGRGHVESWTVNHHPWFPGFDPPYVIAFVNPVEDGRVRLLTNLVNVNPDDVTMSMPVRVIFEPGGDDNIYLPVFEPER